jgi:predicted AAA+ superfamily ATPase
MDDPIKLAVDDHNERVAKTHLLELEAKQKELEIELREYDISFRETKLNQGLDLTSIKQENLRRAIETSSNALDKISKVNPEALGVKELRDLLLSAVGLLKEEIEKK